MKSSLDRTPRTYHVSRLEIVGALCLAMLVGGFGGLTLAAFMEPEPPLVRELGGAWDEVNREFAERVAREFPIGSSETALISTLESQGFSPSWHDRESEREAIFDDSKFACRIVAHVWWRADAAGKILSLRSKYGEEGCL